MKYPLIAVVALLLIAGTACSAKVGTSTPRETKLVIDQSGESFYLWHNGKKRTGVMHVPARYDGSIPCSLVFALHGKGMTGARFREVGFDEYADRYNFIMVYPDAIGGIWEIYPGIKGEKDDLAFFKIMLEGFRKKYRIESSRVYVTGHSMGGDNGVEVKYRLYARGGHNWPHDATRVIADFFYNHPARDNRVSFHEVDQPLLATSTDAIPIEVLVDKPDEEEKVELVRKGEVIGSIAKSPYVFEYRPEMNAYEKLYARVRQRRSAVSTSDFFKIVATPKNLAERADTASGESEKELPSANAVDGNLNTRWGSGFSDGEYLRIDPGETKTVRGVSLFWENAYAKQYAIEVSGNAVDWTCVFRQDKGTGGNEFVQFTPTQTRYVRFKGITRSTPYGYSLWEMMVH